MRRTLERGGLLVHVGERLALGPEELVNDFLLYLELQEQYDPLTAAELAELVGLPEEEAHVIARRVLAARLADARRAGAQQLVDTYSTYLALKQRFEYAEE